MAQLQQLQTSEESQSCSNTNLVIAMQCCTASAVLFPHAACLQEDVKGLLQKHMQVGTDCHKMQAGRRGAGLGLPKQLQRTVSRHPVAAPSNMERGCSL